MYPGSGGFSPAVRNLSSGALDYWIECNLASCIEFMYPGSAGLIETPVEPNPSSVALDYCSEHNLASCVNSMKTFQRRICMWRIYCLGDSNREGQRNFKSNFQKTLIRQLKLTSWQEGLSRRSRLYGLGLEGLASCDLCFGSGGLRSRSWPGKLRPLFGFWGLEVVAWQAATSVWASGGIGVVAWQAVNLFLGSGGLRLWTEAASSVWASGGIGRGLASCDFCLGSGGLSHGLKLRLLLGIRGHRGRGLASCDFCLGIRRHLGRRQASCDLFLGSGGLTVVAWQAATSVWVLGEQIEIWPGQSQLLSGQSRMLGSIVAGQPGQLSCLCRGFIAGKNLPNCLRDGVLGWLWAVWPT
ncbi:hypothetical protein B0H14DRAFT_3160653 [Mycena olivaceomarginata]|nr:hypothetical protein B0H14DRAFT_3160653 [Mycena olivaceomarginata]